MRLSELIAHAEGLVVTVRDFHRGSDALVDRMNAVAAVSPKMAEAVQALGRKNAALRAAVAGLREQGRKDRSEIARLKDRAQSAERRTDAHRATIQRYYDKLQQELGNPTDGKTASANTDGE